MLRIQHRWCRHPKHRKMQIPHTDHEWCGRCGAVWVGQYRKNGAKEWVTPQISIELNLSRLSQ